MSVIRDTVQYRGLLLFILITERLAMLESAGTVKNYAQIRLQTLAECGQPAIETSSGAASKCFIFMYFLLPH